MRVRDVETKSMLSKLVLHFARFHRQTDWFILNDPFRMVLFSALEQMHCTLHVFISSNSSHWVISCFQNPPNSDMDYTVFTTHTSYYTWSVCMSQYTHTGNLKFVISSEGFSMRVCRESDLRENSGWARSLAVAHKLTITHPCADFAQLR